MSRSDRSKTSPMKRSGGAIRQAAMTARGFAAAASENVRLFPFHNDQWRRSAQARSE